MFDNPSPFEGLDAVRSRPELYVGPLDAADLPTRLVLGGLAHALNRAHFADCSRIDVYIREDGVAGIAYDAGMLLEVEPERPFPAAHYLFSEFSDRLLTGSPEWDSVISKFGLPILNALSASIVVSTHQSDRRGVLRYSRGKLHADPVVLPAKLQPLTNIAVELDHELLRGNVRLTSSGVDAALQALTRLPVAFPVIRAHQMP